MLDDFLCEIQCDELEEFYPDEILLSEIYAE